MKVLIVDDEPIARQVLGELLEEMSGVQVVGVACDGQEAVEQIAKLQPEVACLDLQMPGMDGFSVARALRGHRLPLLIYVTAFDNHALEAFDTGAVDYLLKPVRKERLAAALQKARAQLKGLAQPAALAQAVGAAHAGAAPASAGPRRIVGRSGEEMVLVDPAEIIAFRAEGERVQIVTAHQKYEAEQTLRVLEGRLPSPPFKRIHRSTIINTDHIRKISPLSSKRWLLKLSNGTEAIVSKRMAGLVREATGW
jgi:DNA-binding LytR/AlgR family response regulator